MSNKLPNNEADFANLNLANDIEPNESNEINPDLEFKPEEQVFVEDTEYNELAYEREKISSETQELEVLVDELGTKKNNQDLATLSRIEDKPLNSGINSELLLDNVSITITAKAGSCKLNLRELAQLQLNQIIDIAPLPPKVTLYANELVIGEGYLVELNGRMGLKITHLNLNKATYYNNGN